MHHGTELTQVLYFENPKDGEELEATVSFELENMELKGK